MDTLEEEGPLRTFITILYSCKPKSTFAWLVLASFSSRREENVSFSAFPDGLQ